MKGFFIKVILTGVAVIIATYLLPGVTITGSFFTAFIFAFVLALLNTFVKPVLTFLTIPITILTLGIFLIIINVGMVLLADYLVSGIDIAGFFAALIFAIVIAILTWILDLIF
ncbi:phage holin family protein [Pontibacter arcticus]|uniref:Phage holin family protein n=1 Tax=Pontibacter arcticus TaxID=2080288 RepID=A0A364RFN4_9BACT|nr:phage holin family protein [Pontibacter arcticus]RAU83111.1 phage holin family protein [Pontibacter arcticus]